MKKIVLLGITITILLSLCGCTTIKDEEGYITDLTTGEKKEERFIVTYKEEDIYIITDKKTKVQYIIFQGLGEGE